MLRKVSALLAQADHPNTGPAEADTFRQKAEALMFKYRIDETMLTAEEKVAQGIAVQWMTFDVCDAMSEFKHDYLDMFRAIVAHLDIRADYYRTVGRHGGDIAQMTVRDMRYVIDVVGYESDLLMVAALWNELRISFGKLLEPQYDPSLSDQVNAYVMRSAGMEGHRIAMAIYGKNDKALRPKVRKMFAAEATARGEDPGVLLGRGSNMKVFRESYALGFRQEITRRLYDMRMSRGQVSQGLVLANRKEAIDEAFYTRFPERRPKPVPAIGEHKLGTCPKCAKALSGYCRDHAWMRPKAGRVRYENGTGVDRGARAARTVNLGITSREVGP